MEAVKLRKGQSVLIHSAAGGVGIASIHLCHYIGAEIFVTAGTDEKRQYLAERFGIPRSHIFSSRTAEFGQELQNVTNGRGVDYVLNSLTGDLLDESWRCLTDNGVLLEIGKKDIVDRNPLPMEPFYRNCTYRAIDISQPSIDQDLEVVSRILSVIVNLLEKGYIRPIEPIKIFSFAEIVDAMKYMRNGTQIGKVVISDCEAQDVQVPVRPAPLRLDLDPEGAYVLIGGLKGVCGSLAIFLVQHGARELIVMSRTGADDERSRGVLRDVAALGGRTTIVQGDVSSAQDVTRMFENAQLPIKGIIQGAMVLRVSILDPFDTLSDGY
jgi:hypothetical protein